VSVRRHDMANALALPGARVMLLSGLIARARSRSPSTRLSRNDVPEARIRARVGSRARTWPSSWAGYSREAERAADAYAVDLMTRAGGNGAALADILERTRFPRGPSSAAMRSRMSARAAPLPPARVIRSTA
jgi:predicted Zn-dependent protease